MGVYDDAAAAPEKDSTGRQGEKISETPPRGFGIFVNCRCAEKQTISTNFSKSEHHLIADLFFCFVLFQRRTLAHPTLRSF